MRTLGSSDLSVHPLCLGGNVFGWTADEQQSFAVLDAYAAAGGNFIDTADVVLGLGARQQRRRVGDDHRPLDGGARQPRRHRGRDQGRQAARPRGPGAATIRERRRGARSSASAPTASTSTTRTSTTRSTPLEETLGAFDELIARGQGARTSRASNYSAAAARRGARGRRRARACPRTSRCSRTTTSSPRRVRGRAAADLCAREGVALRPVLRRSRAAS